jgi:hypothetical protein
MVKSMLRRTYSALLIGLALVVLTGCFPYVMTYIHLDGPGITHVRVLCGDMGAPAGALYQHDDVSFLIALEPHGLSRSKEGFIRLRAPRNVAISIPDPVVRITFFGENAADPVTVRLEAAPLDWQGPYAEERRRRSPFEEYRFVFMGFPKIDGPGSLQLPIVLVDGLPVELPELEFERKRYAGIAPINC